MPTRPLYDAHAIAEVVFILEFDQPFTKEQLESVLAFKESLKDDLPVTQKREAITSKIEFKDGQATQSLESPSPVIAGITFQHIRGDGMPDWIFRIEGSLIAVHCTDYSGWTITWERARRYISLVMPKILVSGNSVRNIALKYLDHFLYEGDSANYMATDLFDLNSVYLTRNCFQVGQWWHVHQGWFEDVNDKFGCSCLNVLNISTNQTDSGHATIIDGHLQLQVGERSTSINSVELLLASESGAPALLDHVMSFLHLQNKKILINLLQPEMTKRIGLA